MVYTVLSGKKYKVQSRINMTKKIAVYHSFIEIQDKNTKKSEYHEDFLRSLFFDQNFGKITLPASGADAYIRTGSLVPSREPVPVQNRSGGVRTRSDEVRYPSA